MQRSGDRRDSLVSQTYDMFGGRARPADIVGVNIRHSIVGMSSNVDERYPVFEKNRDHVIVQRRIGRDHTVEITASKDSIMHLVLIDRSREQGQDKLIATPVASLRRPAQHQWEIGIGEQLCNRLGYDHPKDVCLIGCKAPRNRIRPVPTLFDCLLHTKPRGLVHVWVVVDDAGDRGARDACCLGDFFERGYHSTSLRALSSVSCLRSHVNTAARSSMPIVQSSQSEPHFSIRMRIPLVLNIATAVYITRSMLAGSATSHQIRCAAVLSSHT